jgi:hypothetical protein
MALRFFDLAMPEKAVPAPVSSEMAGTDSIKCWWSLTSKNGYIINGYCRICVLNADFLFWEKICKTKTTFKAGSYPSDLHEIGCKTNGKTRPVVPVMVPRPETVKWRSFVLNFRNFKNRRNRDLLCKVQISIFPCTIYPFPDVQW